LSWKCAAATRVPISLKQNGGGGARLAHAQQSLTAWLLWCSITTTPRANYTDRATAACRWS
jgi:hypothetical protein